MPALTYDVAHSSSLDYRTRLNLHDVNGAEYQRLWLKAYAPTVWERLMDDADTRQKKRASSIPYTEGAAVPFNHHGTLSGFSTNTSKAVYTPTLSFKSGLNPELQPSQVIMNHPLLSRRFIQKHRLDYLAAIRPDTETATQTQRMLGTYEPDIPHARKAQVHIAPICPAAEGNWFHPDVKLSNLAYTVALRAHASMQPRDKMAEMRASRSRRPHSAQLQAASVANQEPSQAAVQGNTPVRTRPVSAHPSSGASPDAAARTGSFSFQQGAAPTGADAGRPPVSPQLARAQSLRTATPPATPAGLSRPASARMHSTHTVGAAALRPTSACAAPSGPGALDALHTMVRDASHQPRPQLIAQPQDAITRRVQWGAF